MSTVATETPDFSGSSIKDAIEAYMKAGNPLRVPHIEIATWIVNNDLFDVPFETKVKQCDRMVADALKAIHYTDSETGEQARRYGCALGPWIDSETGKQRQKYLWDDMLSCDADFAHAAYRHMHGAIGKDCRALAKSAASWNARNPNLQDNPIQLSWDFNKYVGEDADPKKPR